MVKQVVALIIGVFMTGVSGADIAVDFRNDGSSGPILKAGETIVSSATILDPGKLVQLVWRVDNVGYQNGDLDISLANYGDFILATSISTDGGIFNAGAVGTYTDLDVGGADINSGYFFARFFSGTGTLGDTFLEMGLQGPLLTEFNPLERLTVYYNSMNDLGAVAVESQIALSSGVATQVIPEPTTFGLLGTLGLGIFFARRRFRN